MMANLYLQYIFLGGCSNSISLITKLLCTFFPIQIDFLFLLAIYKLETEKKLMLREIPAHWILCAKVLQ